MKLPDLNNPTVLREILVAYGCVGLWITLSATVILYNKWVLAYFGFPYPVALTMMHMFFCSAIAFMLIGVLKVLSIGCIDGK